jgi:hypothetical protein
MIKQILAALLFLCVSANAATTYTCIATGGNWNSTATWGGGGFPAAGDITNTNGSGGAAGTLIRNYNGGTLLRTTGIQNIDASTYSDQGF